MFVCMSVCMSVCLYVRLYVCLYVCLFVCLYVCLFVRLFVCSSVCPSVYMSVSSTPLSMWIYTFIQFTRMLDGRTWRKLSHGLEVNWEFENVFCHVVCKRCDYQKFTNNNNSIGVLIPTMLYLYTNNTGSLIGRGCGDSVYVTSSIKITCCLVLFWEIFKQLSSMIIWYLNIGKYLDIDCPSNRHLNNAALFATIKGKYY